MVNEPHKVCNRISFWCFVLQLVHCFCTDVFNRTIFFGVEFASIGTRSELLDDFIAVAAAVFIKSTNMKEWYGALDNILTRGILSMGFLRAYASYNILVIFLKYVFDFFSTKIEFFF